MEGYDGHIIFKVLNSFDNIDIQVIHKKTEKYMSIIVNRNIVFLISNQFYKGKLDNHASHLNIEDLLSEFPIDKLELLKRKDAYPYEWVDTYNKFNNKELPPKECFYSSIKYGKRGNDNGHISNKQYLHLQNGWNAFNFNTFRDFHNHYLKKEVLLLADVLEKFISTCIKNYNLNPCHYFSASVLSWDAMLKKTKVELEKNSDPDIHLFIEKGMRWGISYINKRHSKANNENFPDYDKKTQKIILVILIWIIYMDMQWVNIYCMEDLYGLKLLIKQLIKYWIKEMIVYMVIF